MSFKLGQQIALLPISQVQEHFTITDTKRYLPVVTLSTQFNSKLLQQLDKSFLINQ